MRQNLAKLVRASWFLGGIAAIIILSHHLPGLGVWLGAHGASKAAIIALFIMSGVSVSLGKLNSDLGSWRGHLLIQAYGFLLTPAVIYFTSRWLPDGPLKYGVYLVAVLPTTMSSSIAFTTAAGGSAATAILNAVGGNIIGIVVSPLLLGLLIGSRDVHGFAAAGGAMRDMCLLVLVPFAVGQGIGCRFPTFRERVRRIQAFAAQLCVLLLMYCAFSKSLSRLLAQMATMWQCFAYLAAAHIVFVAGAVWATKIFRLPPDRGAAMIFCSTQKTMAFGIPLAYVFFQKTDIAVGVVIIPLIFYYLLQMISSSVVLQWWLRRVRTVAEGRPCYIVSVAERAKVRTRLPRDPGDRSQ